MVLAGGSVLFALVFIFFGVAGCPGTGGGGNQNDNGAANTNDNAPANENENENENENVNVNENDNVAENQPPTADAGADQSATGGDTVILDGSGSDDPDAAPGDTLAFAWTQVLMGGVPVDLEGADTDTATFTAPDEDAVLTFQLEVTDADGATDTDEVVITVEQATVPRLFIANFGGDGVISYANPSTVNGNIAPDTNLDGAQTQLNDPADIVVNSAGQLLAANFAAVGNASITTYDNAAEANGNLEPDGNVTGAATTLIDPVSLAVNTAEDLLFVADIFSDDILVFAGTTAGTFNGNLAPTRTIASADLNNPFGINFGANDDLYVANNGLSNVVVFANASNLNGTVAATRIITSALFNGLFDVFVDNNDTMFVVDATDGEIYIFNDASSLNGPVTPDFTLDVQPAVAGALTAIAVDSNDVGYIVDFAASAVYSYNNISTRNGTFNPNRTISGAATQMLTPIRVFLTE